jgi:hypothetical protein
MHGKSDVCEVCEDVGDRGMVRTLQRVSFGGTGLHRLRNLQSRLTRVVTRRDGDHG